MQLKKVLLIAVFAVSLTLAIVVFARSSQPTVAEGVPGDYVPPPRSGPVYAGGRGGLGGEVLANPVLSGGTDQGE